MKVKNPNYLNIKIPTWDVIPFLAAIKDKTGGNPKVKKSSYKKTGEIAIIDQGQKFIGGYTNDDNLICNESLPCILFGDHNKIFKFINFPFALGADGVKILTPRDGFDKKFLFYYLKSLRFPDDVGYSRHYKYLKEKFIVKPPFSEQKRIAAILDKADGIRKKREEALKLADSFLRATFLEMFGDPVTNPKGWKDAKLGDFIHSAKDGPHISPKYSESGIPFLSTRHVKHGKIIWEDLKYISRIEAEKQWKKCKPEKGDILYTKGGTTGIAAVFDSDREIAVWVHVALLKANYDKVDSVWLENMLNTAYCYAQSQRFTHGITNQDLGLTRMVNIKMYSPPLDLQKKFSEIEKKLKNSMLKHLGSAVQSGYLFNSLTQRAFRGEL